MHGSNERKKSLSAALIFLIVIEIEN